jgi:hypothetical protein
MHRGKKELIDALTLIVTRKLPPHITEADRRDKLACAYLMVRLSKGEEEWDSIWTEVMKRTGCLGWAETMRKGMH